MARGFVLLLALAVCASANAGDGFKPAEAKAGKVALGVLGDPARFQGMTGQATTTRLLIVGWGQGGLDRMLQTMGPKPMLGLGDQYLPPAKIASGEGDDFLLAINQAVANFKAPMYVRPMGEMNGHWNYYCAYDQAGHSKGAAFSTEAFRKAFARIYLAVHGGAGVNAKLRKLGMPPFRGALAANSNASVVWNPQGYGSPDLPGNTAQAYFPGDAYVDVVGDDLYYINGKAEWAAADALYNAHPNKPFAFPEWGLWGLDAPTFVSQMADFVKSHPRTKLIVYFNGSTGSVWDLASKPGSRASYRKLISALG